MKEEISDYYASIIIHRAMVIYWNLLANSIDMWNSSRIPQLIEKWFDTYEKPRYRYDSIDDFVNWYNEIKPHFISGITFLISMENPEIRTFAGLLF